MSPTRHKTDSIDGLLFVEEESQEVLPSSTNQQATQAVPIREDAPSEEGSPSSDAHGEQLDTRLIPGELVEHFKIKRLLGFGGMSHVYLARDLQLGRHVALKVIQPQQMDSWGTRQRFLQEARATARFNHPNIVGIYAVGEWKGSPYVALEYLEGSNLRQRLNEQPLPLKEALRLGMAVCDALIEAHRFQVLHCDLKPENILLPRDGRPRVVDFGLARVLSSVEDESASKVSNSETELDSVISGGKHPFLVTQIRGTPAYMAPEQWLLGRYLSTATDVWAFGILLFECLSDRRPFVAASFRELRELVCGKTPPEAISIPVPDTLNQLILNCLQREPEKRPAVEDIRQILQELLYEDQSLFAEGEGPFPGLMAFNERHAQLFFGREEEISAFLERIRERPCLPIIGPSGAGKSSFLFAGVLPRLVEQEQWLILRIRPGNAPFQALASRLLTHLSPEITNASQRSLDETTASLDTEQTLAKRLLERPRLLSLLLQGLAEERKKRVLVVVDQMEELITLVTSSEIRRRFVSALYWTIEDALDPIRMVFTLRDDYLGRFAESYEAQKMLSEVTLLRIPDKDALRAILSQPVKAVGYRFSSDTLVEKMIQEVEGEAAGLPLLQFTCRSLWEKRDRKNKVLLESVYEELGGVGGALSEHADGILNLLTSSQRDATRRLLLRLVTSEQTRRVTPREEALQGLGLAGEQALDRLIQARLVTTHQEHLGQEESDHISIELVHESLITRWKTLQDWIEESRDEIAFRLQLEQVVDMWDRRGRRAAEVWRGEALEEAVLFHEKYAKSLSPRVGDFLQQGQQVDKRLRRTRRFLGAIGLLLLFGLVFGSLFFAYTLQDKNQQISEKWARSQQYAARTALLRGKFREARSHLRAAAEHYDSPSLRAYWRRLQHGSLYWKQELGVELEKVAFSPKGSWIAVSGKRGSLFVFHVKTGEQMQLLGHGDAVVSLAFSPDGKWLASGGWKGTIRLWKQKDKRFLFSGILLKKHKVPVNGLRFHPNKPILVSSGYDQSILWDLRTYRPVDKHPKLGPARCVAFDAKGQWLVLAGYRATIRLWDFRSKRLYRFRDASGRRVYRLAYHIYTIAFSPDRKWLATAGAGKVVMLWRMKSLRYRHLLRGHTNVIASLAFSPDGKWLASSSYDKKILLWDLKDYRWKRVLQGHTNMVRDIAYSPGGRWLASVGHDRYLRIWRMRGSEKLQGSGHAARVTKLSFGPRGKIVASGSYDRTIRIWDVKRGHQFRVLKGHQGSIRDVTMSPDGDKLGSIGYDNTIRLWDVSSGQETRLFRGYLPLLFSIPFSPFGQHTAMVRGPFVYVWDLIRIGKVKRWQATGFRSRIFDVSFHPNNRQIASVSSDNQIRLWSLSSQKLEATLKAPYRQFKLAFSPLGRRLVSSGFRPNILLWDLQKNEVARELKGHKNYINHMVFEPIGMRLVSGGMDGTVRLWNLLNGKSKTLFSTPQKPFFRVAYRPDGNQIAASCADQTIRIWDVKKKRQFTLSPGPGRIGDLRYSPDGKYLASSGAGGTVRLWESKTLRPYWRSSALLPKQGLFHSHRGWEQLSTYPKSADKAPVKTKGKQGKVAKKTSVVKLPKWKEVIAKQSWRTSSSHNGRYLMIQTGKEQLQVWDVQVDKRIFEKKIKGLRRFLSLDDGTSLILDAKGLSVLEPSGKLRYLAKGVHAFFYHPKKLHQSHSLWVVNKKHAFSLHPKTLRTRWRFPLLQDRKVSAIGAIGQWLAVGYTSGQPRWLPLVQKAKKEPPTLKSLPLSSLTHILPGPHETVILGYANGGVGLWSLRTGRRLEFIRLHGSLQHLVLYKNRLMAASELGEFIDWDLSLYQMSYCQWLRDIWKEVPLSWEKGRMKAKTRPKDHACLK